jgi:hypothetical protein
LVFPSRTTSAGVQSGL